MTTAVVFKYGKPAMIRLEDGEISNDPRLLRMKDGSRVGIKDTYREARLFLLGVLSTVVPISNETKTGEELELENVESITHFDPRKESES